jgi:hypothetical protein
MLNTDLDAWEQVHAGPPGSISLVNPAGFAADLGKMQNYREAKTQYGCAAILAVLSLLVIEGSIELGSTDVSPVIRHLDEDQAVSPFFFGIQAVLTIGVLET